MLADFEPTPDPGPKDVVDETLQLYFLCAHPSVTAASAIAQLAHRVTVAAPLRSDGWIFAEELWKRGT